MIKIVNTFFCLIKKYPFVPILIGTTLSFIYLAKTLPIQFEENDDVTMLLVSSGAYSGIPDMHIEYINSLMGGLICILYKLNQTIEWYSILFSLIHIVSLTIIFKSIIVNKEINILMKVMFVIIILLFERYFITNFQFTTVALLLGVSGIILFLKNERIHKIVIGVLLLVISSLVRFDSALLIILILSPLIIINLSVSKKKILICIIAFLIIILFKITDNALYQKTNWQQYRVLWGLNSSIMDNPKADKIVIDKMYYINPNDFILYQYGLIDHNILNVNKIKLISQKTNEFQLWDVSSNFIANIKSFLIGDNTKLNPPIFALCLFLFVILFITEISIKQKIALFFSFCIGIMLLFYIPIFLTLKSRVFFSLLFTLFISTILVFKKNNKNFIIYFFLFIPIYYFGDYVFRLTRDSRTYNNRKKEMYLCQKSLFDKYDGRVVPVGGSLIVEGENPFHFFQTFKHRKLYSMALAESPLNKGICNRYTDFINGPGLFMGRNSVTTLAPMIIESIQRNYGIKCSYRVAIQNKESAIVEIYKE